jgi:hypothetical protein
MLWVMVTMCATRFIVMESLLRTKRALGSKLETF